MNIKSRFAGDVTVLELNGRFDKNTAPIVRQWLEKASTAAPAYVVVNLMNVNFVDSTALAVLVQGVKRCRQKEGDLFLCSIQQPVYMIFELTRLDRAFNIFPDEHHAVQAFNGE
jgi:anti-sigma B factor antagonist